MITSLLFRPKPSLSDKEIALGSRMLVWEGMCSNAMFSVVTSGLLAAYALALGANNLQIGIISAIPFITQLAQIPSVLLVERYKSRKAISTVTFLVGQLLWFLIASIPLFTATPGSMATYLLIGILAVRGTLMALSTTAWNGWVRDLLPQYQLGDAFSKRLAWGTVATIIFGIGSALFIDYWRGRTEGDTELWGYTLVLLVGASIFGLTAPIFMAFMPEREMAPVSRGQPSVLKALATPLRDPNFRPLILFLFLYMGSLYLAVPFFAVYMLQRLDFPITAVIGLYMLSQVSNLMFVRVWGGFVDRFSNKAVLSLCSSLHLLVLLGWTFTTMPESYFLTIPLLVVLHILLGAAQAGLTLGQYTIGMKLAPEAESTSYLAAVSLALSLGIGIGPLLGGAFANFFEIRELSLGFSWVDPDSVYSFPVVHLTGFDFLFAVAFILGLYTLRFLTGVKEEGEVEQKVVLQELMARSEGVSRAVAWIPGLHLVSGLPLSLLRWVPGLDVAMGVMGYELATSTRTAVSAASKGRNTAADIAERVAHAVNDAAGEIGEMGTHGVDLARQATRGAMHGIGELSEDVGHLARGGIQGVFESLGRTPINSLDMMWGVSYGVIQGADEIGADLGEIAAEAVEESREAAKELGVPEKEATTMAAEGALAAAETLGEEAVSKVREALPDELLPDVEEES